MKDCWCPGTTVNVLHAFFYSICTPSYGINAKDQSTGVIYSRSCNQRVPLLGHSLRSCDAIAHTLNMISLSFYSSCPVPHPSHPRFGNTCKYNSQNKIHSLFIHSINRQGMSSCYVTASREGSENKVMKKTHSLCYIILRFMKQREKHSANITTRPDASFMSLDFIPQHTVSLSLVGFITIAMWHASVLLVSLVSPSGL